MVQVIVTQVQLFQDRMCVRCPLPSVVHETPKETNLAQSLNAQMVIMVDKCKVILQLLRIFHSAHPVTTNIFSYPEDLHVSFTANKELQYKACVQYFANHVLPFAIKIQILATVSQA
ncbi:Anaphase-promoting complex subunit 1 [Labeo rohita]|uniref:Anaphase-promoting complex subunit 1 n=1 Tax=Labeo rohita TaxID=84645 RepID=A0ABQ8LD64_LABRO|nr:Anaphase-promoting complex subunit 1 [Labeo rohita]